jgi:glycosyltransferase involved in cell wall biosynthesis
MEKVFLSVVMPSYQQGQYIDQAIRSVRGAGDESLELWVMDGGSTDNTVKVLEFHAAQDSRVRWISEPDAGQSHAINKGIARCSGEVFNWLNSDDYWDTSTFAHLKRYFQKMQIDVICGRCRVFEDSDENKTVAHYQMPQFHCVYKTVLSDFCAQPSTFWRREVIDALGGVKQDLRCVMDWHLWVRYLIAYGMRRVRWVPEVLAHFRLHSASKTTNQTPRFHEEIAWVHGDLFAQAGAPAELVEYVRGNCSLHLEPTHWVWGKHFDPQKLFYTYCVRQAHRLRKDLKRREEARWLLSLAWKLRSRLSLLWLQSWWRIRS